MEDKPTEEQLEEWGKPITEAIRGFTKNDFEPLFERFILPIYKLSTQTPFSESKWKIINRETGEEWK